MLELIFQGFLEWTYGLTLEAWEYFSSVLLDLMSLDFAYLRTHMPIIDTIMEIMLAVGWALLLGNLVFQAVKGMVTGLGFEAEDPKLLFTRTFVFAFLLLASPQICRIGLDMTATIIDLLEMPDAVDITFADEASFSGLTASWLLVILCGVIVMFQTFKLIMEMAERYFILAVLTITAPLAFGMGGSRNTSDIFTGWCRMFGSMCLLMALNVVFMKMLLSVLSFYPSGLDVLPWMVLVITVVKVAKKADGLLARIGLNPAMTGDTLGRGLPGMLAYTVIRTMASNAARTMGKGGTSEAPAFGSGKPNGPRSGGPSGTRAGTSTNSHRTQSYNTTSQQAGTPKETNSQQTMQQDTAQHTNPQNSTATSSAAQTVQASSRAHTSRNTSVPQGTRRAPSHVPQQPSAFAPAQYNQTTNTNGTIAAAAAAGAVLRNGETFQAGSKQREKKASHTTQPKKGYPAVPVSGSSKKHSPNTQTLQISSRETTQQEHHSSGQISGKPVHAGGATTQNLSADRSVPKAGMAESTHSTHVEQHSRDAAQTVNSSTHNQGASGAQQHPTSGVKDNTHPSIGGRYTQQERQTPRSAEHSQSGSGVQTKTAQSRSEMRSTNRERAGGLNGTTPAAAQSGESVSAVGSMPKTSTAEPKAVSIGGRYTQQERQTVHSAEHNQSSSGAQMRTTQSQSEMRSTNRERTGGVSGTNPIAMQSGERPSAGGSMPKSGTAETKPVSIGGRYTQQEGQSFHSAEHSQTNVGIQPSSASVQSHSVTHQSELRSTNSSPVGTTQIGAKSAVQSQPQRPASSDPRSTQRPQTEQRATQHNIPAAQQEAGPMPRTATTAPSPASPSHSAQPGQRSIQRNMPAVQQETGTVQRAATTVPPTVSPSRSTQPEQRSMQRNPPAVQQEGRISTQAKRPVSVQQELHHPATSKREHSAVPHSDTAQQEQPQTSKKTFVPLSGRQPESIPSHLELKQEPQKSTKRPDAAEGGGHVTE